MSRAKGTGLWERAKELIPGGNQLLSKRSEMFLPGEWPSFYDRAEGCEVWDLDGNRYYDFAQMGVGSCVLGYADPDVNRAVTKAVEKGSMSTLNSHEEISFAEKLLGLHPWADMARFARTGGEACAQAVRIARAASGKDKVAFCGYHGWHDWYLASNLADDSNLDGQLLPGLEPKGVPRGLRGTAIPFQYNDLESLREVADEHGDGIGVIYMEPRRRDAPAGGFLEGVREIADRLGAVLVFDEITAGFRINPGGIHLNYGVEPDMAVFGKAIGNGFPISAVIGRREVMDHGQDTFISSTFWTERIGFTAGLATVEKYLEEEVHKDLVRWGEKVSDGWRSAAGRAGLEVEVTGLPPLTHLKIECHDPGAAQTWYTWKMLERGFLAASGVYTTWAYTDEIVDRYLEATEEVFSDLAGVIERGEIESQLPAGKKHAGFKRLT